MFGPHGSIAVPLARRPSRLPYGSRFIAAIGGFVRNVGLAEPAPSVHVDATAYAALRALDRGEPGLFNIAHPSGELSTTGAIAEFGWRSDFRIETD